MSASSFTESIILPQFNEDDKPSWLGDFNSAMRKIDQAIATRDLTIAQLTASLNSLTARVTALENA